MWKTESPGARLGGKLCRTEQVGRKGSEHGCRRRDVSWRWVSRAGQGRALAWRCFVHMLDTWQPWRRGLRTGSRIFRAQSNVTTQAPCPSVAK